MWYVLSCFFFFLSLYHTSLSPGGLQGAKEPSAMSDNVSLAKANAIVATATSTTCGICDEEISEADKAQIALKKLASGYCLADSYALRAFQQCCKAQKTESQMDRLRDENKELWKGTVLAFREQRRTGRGTNFDVLKHLETVKKAFVQDNDDVWRPLIFAAYVKHYMNLPQPFTLTEAQATAQWHSDLRNPQIKKSEKKYFNPKSRQDEAAWPGQGHDHENNIVLF